MTDGMVGEAGIVIPDVASTIVGYRAFNYNWRLGRFQSCMPWSDVEQRQIWLPGDVVEARCSCIQYDKLTMFTDWGKLDGVSSCENPPEVSSTCGVHAFKNLREAVFQYARTDWNFYGEVWLWGKVIEHQRGYRAQYAELKSISYLMPRYFRRYTFYDLIYKRVATRMGHIYGVPMNRITAGDLEHAR